MSASRAGGRVRVLAVWTPERLSLDALTVRERAHVATLPGLVRRRRWLTSRWAQRLLLGLLGLPRDTTAYAYPHRRLSLTHTDHGSVAACAVAPLPETLVGIGVDLEPVRPVDLRTARFFLDERERGWLAGISPRIREEEHLRLWTVKEALFKADPGNSQTTLRDYAIHEAAARAGRARRRQEQGTIFGYACGRLPDAHLSMAAAFRRGPSPRRTPMPLQTVAFEQVAQRISETLSVPARDLTPETRLQDLTADSFMLVEMVVDLQEEFGAMFTQAELRDVSTLAQLVELLRSGG